MLIKKNDNVVMVAGDNVGKRGRVLKTLPKADTLLVEGVNVQMKHLKRSQQNPQGGRREKEGAVHVSNVLLVCPKCNRGVRVGRKPTSDGKLVRSCKVCGEAI